MQSHLNALSCGNFRPTVVAHVLSLVPSSAEKGLVVIVKHEMPGFPCFPLRTISAGERGHNGSQYWNYESLLRFTSKRCASQSDFELTSIVLPCKPRDIVAYGRFVYCIKGRAETIKLFTPGSGPQWTLGPDFPSDLERRSPAACNDTCCYTKSVNHEKKAYVEVVREMANTKYKGGR